MPKRDDTPRYACTMPIGRNLDTGRPITCGQPADYLVVTINPETNWSVANRQCAGCASHALSRAQTAELDAQSASTKVEPKL